MPLNPLSCLARTLWYVLTCRLHFPADARGSHFEFNGQSFEVFRQAMVDPAKGQPQDAGAVFMVRFHIAGMSPGQNIRFSLLPIPVLVGVPGFRSKLWGIDRSTGDFAGKYMWDTVEDAESYAASFAMKFMTARALPGSVSYKICPQ